MQYLLDTHTLLWSIGKSSKLSGTARRIIEDSSHEIFASSVSLWEVALKYSLGKILLGSISPEDLPSYCDRLGFQLMPLEPNDASTYHRLAKIDDHRDPFDRMLIHQCIQRSMILISRDGRFGRYRMHGLKCTW